MIYKHFIRVGTPGAGLYSAGSYAWNAEKHSKAKSSNAKLYWVTKKMKAGWTDQVTNTDLVWGNFEKWYIAKTHECSEQCSSG